jgi:hypothetical protein
MIAMLTPMYVKPEVSRTPTMMHMPFTAAFSFLYIKPIFIIYCMASMSRLPARSADRAWKAQIFSSVMWVAKRDPADAKPTIVASCRALQTRSNIESRAKRISKRATCSHVNHNTPRKLTYAQRAALIHQLLQETDYRTDINTSYPYFLDC